MCPLSTGKGRRLNDGEGRSGSPDLYFDTLLAQQLNTRPPVGPATPVTPLDGLRTDHEGMQEHAHLARLCGGAAIPLTLLAQGAGTTTTDARRIHHAQTSVDLFAPLVGHKRLTSRTAQRAIRLEGKVLSRKAASFPGQSHNCRPVSLSRNLHMVQLVRQWKSRSKLGRADWIRMKLMPQFESQVPDPLSDELPALLSPGRVAAPPVWVLLSVFI